MSAVIAGYITSVQSRNMQWIALSAALTYCLGAIVLVAARSAPVCRWSAARTSSNLARLRQAQDDQPAASQAYINAARAALGCTMPAAAMFSTDALVRAGTAYGRADYRLTRDIVERERTVLLADVAATARIAHLVAGNIDFTHRTFVAIDRALESAISYPTSVAAVD